MVTSRSAGAPSVRLANQARSYTLTNSVTKILESLLHSFIESRDKADGYQLGLKRTIPLHCARKYLRKLFNYCRQIDSQVFACFTDFNKAFDSVDY